MLYRILRWLFITLFYNRHPDEKHIQAQYVHITDDTGKKPDKLPLALTYPDDHPTAVLIVEPERSGYDNTQEGATEFVAEIYEIMLHLIYRWMGTTQMPVRYIMDRGVECQKWSFRVSLFYFGQNPNKKLDHLLIAVDPRSVTQFYDLLNRTPRGVTPDSGSGSLEEAISTYTRTLITEMGSKGNRVSVKNQTFPEGLVGWVVKEQKGKEGSIEKWVEGMFKPVLSVV